MPPSESTLKDKLPDDLKNMVDNPITFDHPQIGKPVEIAKIKGRAAYQVKIDGKLAEDLPISEMVTTSVSEIRKSTITPY